VMLAGTPAAVPWHAAFMTGTAVLTLLLLAAAASFQLPSRRRDPRPAAATEPAGNAMAADGAIAAGGEVAPVGSWRSLQRRDAPRWAVVLAAAVALAFAATAGILGVRAAPAPPPPVAPVAGPSPAVAGEHEVIYTVSAPSTVTWMQIVYVDAQGRDQRTTTVPSGLPWVQPIRTGPRAGLVYLAVSIASKSPNTKIQCAIHVDGRRAIASEGPSCNAHVRLP
ncbi:hypothetical protein AB0M20_17850, partial [Actinoplanes sp. NPDC051633]